jgi:hypothetical protein
VKTPRPAVPQEKTTTAAPLAFFHRHQFKYCQHHCPSIMPDDCSVVFDVFDRIVLTPGRWLSTNASRLRHVLEQDHCSAKREKRKVKMLPLLREVE